MNDGNTTLEGPPEENDPVESVKEISRTAQRLRDAETARLTAEALAKTTAAANEDLQKEIADLRKQTADAVSLKDQLVEANRLKDESDRKLQEQLAITSRTAQQNSAESITDQAVDTIPMAESWENLRADAASSDKKVNGFWSIRRRVFNLAEFMKFREASSPGNMVDKLSSTVIPTGMGVAMLVGAGSVGVGATATALAMGGAAGAAIGATIGITIVLGAATVTCVVRNGMEDVAASAIAAYLVAVPMAERTVASFKRYWNEFLTSIQGVVGNQGGLGGATA